MTYTIKAIPTTYAGVNFRSRLEARWAAFFDLMSWRWSYEPIDFDGWIPDFILHGRKERTLVEVKPLYEADERLFNEVSHQAVAARSSDDILVLGAEVFHGRESFPCVAFGWLGEHSSGEHLWAEAVPHALYGTEFSGIGFCSGLYTYHNRITGEYDGDGGAGTDEYDQYILRLWKDAGNIVQWHAKRDAA